MAPTLTKEMTRADFDALVEATHKIIKDSGLTTPVEKTKTDILARFAQLHGVSAEEADKLLDAAGAPAAAATPPPAPVSAAAVKKAAAGMRGLTASGGASVYFYTPPEDGHIIETVVAVKRDGGFTANLLVTGPSGSGKTEGIQHKAAEMGIPFYKVDCASITSPERWVGHKEINEKGTTYVLSEFLRWSGAMGVDPGIVLLDEINRLHPTLCNILFPMLDGSRSIWVPDLNINVDVHPETVFMATANIGTGFSGTHRMDDALTQRFGFRLERDFPPAAEEITILEKRTGIGKVQAKILVDIATQTRQKARNNDISMPVSTRNLLDAAVLVAAGMQIATAAEYTFIKFYTEEGGAQSERVMVRQIVAGKAAGK